MPYRERVEAPPETQRVELLRWTAKPWYTHPSTLAAIMSAALLAMIAPGSHGAIDLALGALVYLAFTLASLRSLWIDASRLVVWLERDADGRRVVVERALGSLVRRRAYRTEEPLALAQDKGEIFTLWLKQKSPVLTVRLLTGAGDRVELFSTTNEAEAERFTAAIDGFDERAAAVPTAAELRRIASEKLRDADQSQRATDERYRAWFDEVIANDDSAGLAEVLDRGFSIDRPVDRDGSTALDLAANRGAARCVRTLIDRGALATPNALSLAAYGAPESESDRDHPRYVETVRVLVEAGADPHGRDNDGDDVFEAIEGAGAAFVAAVKK
jgi:hypothetical protein